MYRIEQGKQEFILRFSRKAGIGRDDRAELCKSIVEGQMDLEEIAGMGTTVFFHNRLGAIVVEADKVPSLVLTVTAVVPKKCWIQI